MKRKIIAVYVPSASAEPYRTAYGSRFSEEAFEPYTNGSAIKFGEFLTNATGNVLKRYVGAGGSVYIEVPDNITVIGEEAFAEIGGAEGIQLPDGLREIGARAFYDCDWIYYLAIPNGVTKIGDQAFYGCDQLHELDFGTGLRTIGDGALDVNGSGGSSKLKCINFRSSKPPTFPEESCVNWISDKKIIYVPTGRITTYEKAFVDIFPSDVEIDEKVQSDYYVNGFHIIKRTLIFYGGSDTDIVIPDDVQVISSKAFINNDTITSVTFPEGLKQIGKQAFYSCDNLSGEVSLPDSVEEIGTAAFSGCKKISGIILGKELKRIESNAFSATNQIKYVIFRGEVPETSLSSTGLRSSLNVFIPDIYKEEYQEISFFPNYSLCTFDLNEVFQETDICRIYGSTLLSYDNRITEVVIPVNVRIIGPNVFSGNKELKRVTFQEGLEEIGCFSFSGCINLCGDLEIPDSVKVIRKEAFSGDKSLSGIILGNGLERIEQKGLYGLSGAKYIFFGESAPEVEALGIVVSGSIIPYIPENLSEDFLGKTIGQMLHYYDSYSYQLFSLNAFTYPLNGINEKTDVYRIYHGVLAFYANASGKLTIPDGTKIIGVKLFYGNQNITEVIVADSVEKIENSSFYRCTELQKLTLGNSLRKIECSAFSGCKKLSGDLFIPESLDEIQYSAFLDCGEFNAPLDMTHIKKAYNVPITDGVIIGKNTEIVNTNQIDYLIITGGEPNEKLYTQAKNIYIDIKYEDNFDAYKERWEAASDVCITPYEQDGMTERNSTYFIYGGTLIQYDQNETDVSLPVGVKIVGSRVFCQNSRLKSVIFPDGLKRIGEYAFDYCTSLTELKNPDSVEEFGRGAFRVCRSLEKINFPSSLRVIGKEALYGCGFLLKIELPDCIEIIGKSALICNSVQQVILGAGLRTIKEQAFENLRNAKYMIFRGNVPEIEIADEPENMNLMLANNYTIVVNKATSIYFPQDLKEAYTKKSFSHLILCYGKYDNVEHLSESNFSTFDPTGFFEDTDKYQIYGSTLIYLNPENERIEIPFGVKLVGPGVLEEAVEDKESPTIYINANEGEVSGISDAVKKKATIVYRGQQVSFTVRFLAGAIVVSEQSVKPSEEITVPDSNSMKKENDELYSYEFLGWDINGDGVADELPKMLTANLTAEAVYKATELNPSSGKEPEPTLTPEEKTRSFVERLYTVAMNRTADQGGLDYWSGLLISQTVDGAFVAGEFINSPEFIGFHLTNEEFINRLYRTFFDREGDEGGVSFWMNGLNSGATTQVQVLGNFVNSEEFTGICASYGIKRGELDVTRNMTPVEKFSFRLYTCILERAGEAEGMKYWAKKVGEALTTPEEAAINFFTSDEYINRNTSNEAYVMALYQTFMGRTPDENGLNFWVSALQENRSTRMDALMDFCSSDEFMNVKKSFGL